MRHLFKYLATLLILSQACVSKKITTKESIRDNTINDTKNVVVIEKIKELKDTLFVDKPCDSLGKLKDFERIIKRQNDIIKIQNKKGKINVIVALDSSYNKTQKQELKVFHVKHQTNTKIVKKNNMVKLIALISLVIILAVLGLLAINHFKK